MYPVVAGLAVDEFFIVNRAPKGTNPSPWIGRTQEGVEGLFASLGAKARGVGEHPVEVPHACCHGARNPCVKVVS